LRFLRNKRQGFGSGWFIPVWSFHDLDVVEEFWLSTVRRGFFCKVENNISSFKSPECSIEVVPCREDFLGGASKNARASRFMVDFHPESGS
jgi:hypothetical protein